jgi:hypothetical protein
MSDIILFAHPTFGVLGIISAVWLFVETLNASEANQRRIRIAGLTVAAFIGLAWIFGGYWYVNYYAPEKAIILKGPWPFAHSFFMETKEHLFFIPLILALYLIVVTRIKLAASKTARAMVMAVAAVVVLNSFAIEGAGAVIRGGLGNLNTGKSGRTAPKIILGSDPRGAGHDEEAYSAHA